MKMHWSKYSMSNDNNVFLCEKQVEFFENQRGNFKIAQMSMLRKPQITQITLIFTDSLAADADKKLKMLIIKRI